MSHDFLADLGGGPSAIVFNSSITFFGIALIAAGVFLFRAFRDRLLAIALVLGFLGVAVFLRAWDAFAAARPGDLLSLEAAAAFGAYGVINHPLTQRYPQRELMAYTLAVGGGVLLTHGAKALPLERPGLVVSLARSGDSPESVGALALLLELHPQLRHLVLTCNADGKLATSFRADSGVNLTDIPTYGQVIEQNVYDGVNVVYQGDQHQLRFDLVVASVVIRRDENQSSSCPLSSTNCSAPIPTASIPMPQ